jgi:hypothetical protein
MYDVRRLIKPMRKLKTMGKNWTAEWLRKKEGSLGIN